MKNKIIFFTVLAAAGYLGLSSHSAGPGRAGYDCTGGESAGTGSLANPTGCTCHTAAALPAISVTLELDSAGVATTHYKPGYTYTVKITGNNASGVSLPKYGFQIAALNGTVSTATESDAGIWSSAVPANTHIAPPYPTYMQLSVAEHSSPLPITGTGFTQSFTWTAPATGVGGISFWAAANFVTGLGGTSSSDHWNTTSLQIGQWSTAGIEATALDAVTINCFPNPATNNFNLLLQNAQPGTYTLHIINMNGSAVTSQNIEVSNAIESASINTNNLATGMYNVVVEKDGNKKSLLVVKQ